MTANRFPTLDHGAMQATRDALHAYARLQGDWLKAARARRKHWWHASLRPSLHGLTTGLVRAATDFELELDFCRSQMHVKTPATLTSVNLTGQSAVSVAAWLDETLVAAGIDASHRPGRTDDGERVFADYTPTQAQALQAALASVAAALEAFRAGIREETSPIQVWPHHFDMSMIWLPGQKIPGPDPADEEYADKQMNFGFVFGDASFAEPYFYVTAYPLPEALPGVKLPKGTVWMSEGFSGAVLFYRDLVAMNDPAGYLQELWSTLLIAGRTHLATDD